MTESDALVFKRTRELRAAFDAFIEVALPPILDNNEKSLARGVGVSCLDAIDEVGDRITSIAQCYAAAEIIYDTPQLRAAFVACTTDKEHGAFYLGLAKNVKQ